jgi:hypothetical protein
MQLPDGLAARPAQPGKLGKRSEVFTNHFPIKHATRRVLHYNITIQPAAAAAAPQGTPPPAGNAQSHDTGSIRPMSKH